MSSFSCCAEVTSSAQAIATGLWIGSSDKTFLVDCGHGQGTANALLAALTESHLRANAATSLPIESKIGVKLPMLCRSHIIRPSHSNSFWTESGDQTLCRTEYMTRITLLMLCRSHIIRPSHSNSLWIGSSDKTATSLPIESKISVKLPMLCRSHIIRPSHSNSFWTESGDQTLWRTEYMTRITLLMLCRSHIIRPSHSNRLVDRKQRQDFLGGLWTRARNSQCFAGSLDGESPSCECCNVPTHRI